MKGFDVVCIGNATEDVFIHIHPRVLGGKAILPAGAKIEIEDMKVFTGGGGTNCSVGFARLGLRTALLAEVGNDESAGVILDELKREGVSRELIIKSGKYMTAYSAILTGFGDRIILTYRGATAHLGDGKKIKWGKMKGAEWLYVSSLHKKPALMRQVAAFADKNRIKVAWNPGKVELGFGLKKLSTILKKTDVLFINAGEAFMLTGDRDIRRNLAKIKKFCRGLVVITAGRKGVYVYDGSAVHFRKPFRVKVLDTTGAGDAFNSAFVSALHYGGKIPEAIDWGCANAASVIQELGTKNILLSRHSLKKFLAGHRNKRLG